MKKTFAVALLVSASLVGCGGKKESTTPVNKDQPATENKDGAAGGAAYGGQKPAVAPAKPDAPK